MNTLTAQAILSHAARLVELAAAFQAQYGKRYALKPGSPQEAWDTYNTIWQLQCQIARMLDSGSLNNPYFRHGKWWDRQDVIDCGLAHEMVVESSRLVAQAAHSKVSDEHQNGLVMINTQSIIAGLLHPATIQVAASTSSYAI